MLTPSSQERASTNIERTLLQRKQYIIYHMHHVHFCVHFISTCITFVHKRGYKVVSFVTSVNSRKHAKLNNEIIFFSIYLSMWDLHFIEIYKGKQNYRVVFLCFFSPRILVREKARFMHLGSKNGRQMTLAMTMWPKMFSIKNVYYQRINCGTDFKWKLKNTMLYKPLYSGDHGN